MFGKRWRRRAEEPLPEEPELHGTGAVAFLLPKDPEDPEDPEGGSAWEADAHEGLEVASDWMPEDQLAGWMVIPLADDLPSKRS